MINIKTTPTLKAEITIGLNKGYSDETWNLEELKVKLAEAQQMLKENEGILLSAKVTLCDIVFLGQDEPSVTLSYINYPKIPVTEAPLKKGVTYIAKELMNSLEQNRIVIVLNDETIMLEKTEEIDKNIDLN